MAITRRSNMGPSSSAVAAMSTSSSISSSSSAAAADTLTASYAPNNNSQLGQGGLSTLLVMIVVLVIILLFCIWGAPGVKQFCRRALCGFCYVDEPNNEIHYPDHSSVASNSKTDINSDDRNSITMVENDHEDKKNNQVVTVTMEEVTMQGCRRDQQQQQRHGSMTAANAATVAINERSADNHYQRHLQQYRQ